MACIYKQKTGKGKSDNWLIAYYKDGKRRTKSSRTTDYNEARAIARSLEGKIADGEDVDSDHGGRDHKAFRFDDAAALVVQNLEARGKAGTADDYAGIIRRHLGKRFGGMRLADITTPQVTAYEAARLTTGAARATVNYELAILRRMYRLAIKLDVYRGRQPAITVPDPQNAREGFFERADFDAVVAALSAAARVVAERSPKSPHSSAVLGLAGMITAAYLMGWRIASELGSLEWHNVDRRAQEIRIARSKNGKGRVFPYGILPELVTVIEIAWREHKRLEAAGTITARVFVDGDGKPLVQKPSKRRRTGALVQWVRRVWREAGTIAEAPTKIPHDFRRTAVRNLVDAGVPERIAMEITGHKTRVVFDRYHIVDTRDVQRALRMLAASPRVQPAPAPAAVE